MLIDVVRLLFSDHYFQVCDNQKKRHRFDSHIFWSSSILGICCWFLWWIWWCHWNKLMSFSMMAMLYIIPMYFRCSFFASSIKSMSDNPLSSLMLVLKKPHYLWLLRMKSWCGIHPRRWTPLFPKIHIGYRRWVWRPNKQLLQLLMDSCCSFGTITFELIRK